MSKRITRLRFTCVLALGLLMVAAAPWESPVADAAQQGDVAQVRTLLQGGADANAAQADASQCNEKQDND